MKTQREFHWHELTRTLQDGLYALYAKKETRHYTKGTMIFLSRRCVGFGVRIAVWFRCSLNKAAENGNRARLILNRETTQNLGKNQTNLK